MGSRMRIAFRNIGRQKKRTVLLAGAIAFGVIVVTLLNGFTAGVSRNIERTLIDVIGGHVYVSGTELTESRLIVNVLRDTGGSGASLAAAVDEVAGEIAEANRRSRTLATLIFGSKQSVQRLDGVDWAGEPSFFSSLKLIDGTLPAPDARTALILPESAAERLRVAVGDQVLARLRTITGQQNVGEFVLVATFDDSGFTAFSAGFAGLDYLGELIGMGAGENQMLHLYLHDPRRSDRVAEALRARLPATAEEDERGGPQWFDITVSRLAEDEEPWEGTRYDVTTIDDVMSQFSDLFRALDIVSLVIFLILLTVTMVGVVNTFRMVLLERVQEIGTMRAMGMQRGAVRSIYLMEAGFIALLGAVAGLVLAGVLMLVAGRIDLSTDGPFRFFLDDGRLTFVVPPLTMVTNVAILLVLSLGAAFIPARRAARLDPAVAQRSAA